MPYSVNGQVVPEQVILEELSQIARDPRWQTIADEAERARRLREAAEIAGADRILIEQLAMKDPRPIDPGMITQHLENLKAQTGFRTGLDDHLVRQATERQLRVQRMRTEMVADAEKPTPKEIEDFYAANQTNFQQPELFHAAHVVKYINHVQNRQTALAKIGDVLIELERGAPFSEVANRHSDCSDKDGDVGEFPADYMVPAFESEIRALEPGERSGIFETPFGFHIAMLIGRTPVCQAPFERVRSDIDNTLSFFKRHEMYMRKLEQLRAQADIRWVPAQQAAAR